MLQPLILIAGVAAVGAGAIFGRIGLDAGTSALTLSLWRLAIAATLLTLWRAVRKPPTVRLERSDGIRLGLAGVCLAFHFLTWLASLRYIGVARSTLLVSTTPVWAGLLGFFVPSLKPSRSFWAGLAVAAVGIAIVTTQDSTASRIAFEQPSWLGDLYAVLGAICILPYLLLSQAVQRKAGTGSTVTWIYGAAAATLLVIAVARSEVLPANRAGWISVAGMAVLPQLVGHTIFNWSLRHYSAAQVSTATLLEPVFAGILAAVLFAESLSAPQIVGGVVLLAGVAMTLRRETLAVEAG